MMIRLVRILSLSIWRKRSGFVRLAVGVMEYSFSRGSNIENVT
jgi:hypothetical protein